MLPRRIDAIVIGASAGGIEALSTLLPALPARAPAAVFVVLHLPRERPSLLVDIYTRKCAIDVEEAQDKTPVRTGCVYFAPPDYHLLVDRGDDGRPYIALSVDEPVHYSRPSIDVLFESAADVYAERLLGIVLTGGNEDGAAGLQAIRRAGGLTAAQQPDDAEVPYMPQAALALGTPDFVLPLAGLAHLLRAFGPEDAARG